MLTMFGQKPMTKFFRDKARMNSFKKFKVKIRKILAIFKDRGYNLLIKDLTTRDVKEAGFHSIKVFSPQLIPLHGNHNYPFLGGKRLYEVPILIGMSARPFEGLNPYPHPFP